ncbi:MAG: tRNA glutamyl-Q(34) synthetase GluQRS [Rhodospirillales bacterium]
MDAPVTRFAPSPTGFLHLGHARAALFAQNQARREGGRFLLRIEDIDQTRCRAEFEQAVCEDLSWLGLEWETPVRRQSDCMDDYANALDTLRARGLMYPCFCTRADIRREISAAAAAPHAPALGPDGPLYPGLCRGLGAAERTARIAAGEAHAWRLDVSAAAHQAGPLTWLDLDAGPQRAAPEMFGDAVLARKETPTSYHLAVTLDDHIQGVTRVTRADDLRAAAHLHRLLQALLGLDTPEYRFHPLLNDASGRRLAKREGAKAIRDFRAAGASPEDVREMAGAA